MSACKGTQPTKILFVSGGTRVVFLRARHESVKEVLEEEQW